MSDRIPLYDGALKGNRVSSVVKAGLTFDFIKPGFDAQGRRRTTWTQVVHAGVPIYEVRVNTALDNVLDRFDAEWDKVMGDDRAFIDKALASVKRERLSKFMDGKSGVEPAPSLRDGKVASPKKMPA
ncbi:hypothetical protein BAJUN_03280 [Bajunvirus bajun]|uniref:Uncharacterized protein n=1 Tax=Brevundimonas phage vB_BgoS-Bajun TaxID=2948594 RepID=A0A9E7SU99_9CAUD|nr:hypothetical protein BAJUN_03280 [Brevundimonas phage vB_BgoS-Bajun]